MSREFSRRDFIKGIVGAGVVGAVGAVGVKEASSLLNTSPENTPPDSQQLDVYLPTWLDDSQYNRIAALRLQNVSRFVVAFAVPQPDGRVPIIALPRPLTNFIYFSSDSSEKAVPHQDIGLAVGGYGGTDKEHANIISGWNNILNNPVQFIEDVSFVVDETQATSIDLDFEYPTVQQSEGLTNLVSKLRQGLPDKTKITMAVPADTNLDGYQIGGGGLEDVVDTFHVMTYDKNGPWSEQAGDLAPGKWVIDCISSWVSRVGDASKISVGYPTYGYKFSGAKKRVDRYNTKQGVQTVLFSDIPPSAVHDNMDDLTSTALVDGSWTTLVSPAVMTAVQKSITERFPGIGGRFLWSAEGMTRQHID